MQNVSELTEQIKSLLETTFLHVKVEGEVSRPTYHSSGHLYFTLKDTKSSISCVMFKGNNQRLKFRVEEGMAVCVSGSISVYSPRGSYQINCVSLEPSGSGALALAYEQLKKELSQNGYFDKKRDFPLFPKHIGVVTSKTGAALQDMLNVAKARYPLAKITLFNTLVQGAGASKEIARAIKRADEYGVEIIVVGRGGGSVEDLWAFNEKEVALALYECNALTISAVGHAIDSVISDFVCDKFAPTPSAAMEMILPDKNELSIYVDSLSDELHLRFKNRCENLHFQIDSLKRQLSSYKPTTKLAFFTQEVLTCKKSFNQAYTYKLQTYFQKCTSLQKDFNFVFRQTLATKESELKALTLALSSKNPKNEVKKGFAQVVKDGKGVVLEELKKDDTFELQNTKTTILSQVLKTQINKISK